MSEQRDWFNFYLDVGQKAKLLGYNASQVGMFISDIRKLYDAGKTVDEVVEEIF